MIDAGLAALAAAALFEALRLILTSEDLLRLRTMTRLSLALAVFCAPMGMAPFVVFGVAFAACRFRPELRMPAMLPVLLLLLTPAVGVCVVHSLVWGWAWPQTAILGQGPATAIMALVAFALILPVFPAFGFGWRLRFAACSAAALCAALALAFALGGPAYALIAAGPGVAGAFVLAWRMSDLPALIRLGAGSAAVLGAPLLIFAAQAGPWTQAPGAELLIVRAPLQASGDGAYGVQTYSESGLSDGMTFIASGFQETSRTQTRAGGTAGLRARLWSDGDWIVSGEVSAGVDPFSLNAGTSNWERHAQADMTVMGGWSADLDGAPVYVSAGAGWRIRPDAFGDAALLSISAGIDLASELQANVYASAELNRGEDRVFGQASLLWRIDDDVALEAGVQSATDRDGDATVQAFAGIWLRF